MSYRNSSRTGLLPAQVPGHTTASTIVTDVHVHMEHQGSHLPHCSSPFSKRCIYSGYNISNQSICKLWLPAECASRLLRLLQRFPAANSRCPASTRHPQHDLHTKLWCTHQPCILTSQAAKRNTPAIPLSSTPLPPNPRARRITETHRKLPLAAAAGAAARVQGQNPCRNSQVKPHSIPAGACIASRSWPHPRHPAIANAATTATPKPRFFNQRLLIPAQRKLHGRSPVRIPASACGFPAVFALAREPGACYKVGLAVWPCAVEVAEVCWLVVAPVQAHGVYLVPVLVEAPREYGRERHEMLAVVQRVCSTSMGIFPAGLAPERDLHGAKCNCQLKTLLIFHHSSYTTWLSLLLTAVSIRPSAPAAAWPSSCCFDTQLAANRTCRRPCSSGSSKP